MFKRILLVVCLVAVLVVPGAAYVDFRDDFSDGVDESWIHYFGDGVNTTVDGRLKFGAVGGPTSSERHNYYIYPTALQAPFTVNFKVDTTSTSLLPTLSRQWFGLVTTTANPSWNNNFAANRDIWQPSRGDILYTIKVDESGATQILEDGVVAHTVELLPSLNYYACFGARKSASTTESAISYVDYVEVDPAPVGELCTINVYDADTRLPLSGSWDYDVIMHNGENINGTATGAFKVVNLPATSIYQPHLVYVTKEGYEMTPAVVAVDVPAGGREIKIYMTPLETVVQPGYRSGTVTMTDNNGTTIRGFEVTAVNAYTGMEYTVATDTDVVVMNLSMERTIQIRNPQTGEYEDAPVGYYRFYGQSPGYKMLNEGGIQVSVMPEKYGSYQLCDIRVTQESGYLTGKHQFQIRSRSDNSILQTGTISAKSATTDEWFNTTVSGGIASLILPYDTSNTQSQYAGNYYVYATSPGYEDSDYGTQIVVMPHTVSEIQTVHLTPIGGIPTPGNVTLRIQVFSETGSGIPNAEIFISGVQGAGASLWDTYTASSTGYLTVSVPGNSTYDIVASGAGYYDSARHVEVFDTDPSLIEIKLYLSGAPTVKPTTQPTGWITPTPTQTSPPIQEDSIIGLSVRGLAKGFGIDYDTALLMFGLMIIFGAGGMVMSSVKGGAMEFIAGSIVGTFVAFALGLIPIWIFIIIAVVFGAYVLRVFVQGGQ